MSEEKVKEDSRFLVWVSGRRAGLLAKSRKLRKAVGLKKKVVEGENQRSGLDRLHGEMGELN